jgi:predicted lipid-binding transport protein (Tim44 family)
MRDVFDIYTIIFLALAVFIFLRLRSVLGQRTGRERPPYARDSVRTSASDKVVALPGRAPDAGQKPAEPVEPGERWKGLAEPGSAVATGLDAIAREDKSFDAKDFLTGARAAYEMICWAGRSMTDSTPRSAIASSVAKRSRRGLFRSTAPISPAPSSAARPRR